MCGRALVPDSTQAPLKRTFAGVRNSPLVSAIQPDQRLGNVFGPHPSGLKSRGRRFDSEPAFNCPDRDRLGPAKHTGAAGRFGCAHVPVEGPGPGVDAACGHSR